MLHRAGAEREEPGVDAVVLLRAGARSGASSRARRGRAGRSARGAAGPPRRRRRAPARRGRRRSSSDVGRSRRSAARSAAAPRLPVKVGCSPVPASPGAVGRPWRFSITGPPSAPAAKAARSSSVLTSVAATRSRSSRPAPGSRRETGTPPRMPLPASASTTSAAGLRQPHRELVEEGLVEHLDARHAGEQVGELHRIGVVDAREAAQGPPRRAASCGS